MCGMLRYEHLGKGNAFLAVEEKTVSCDISRDQRMQKSKIYLTQAGEHTTGTSKRTNLIMQNILRFCAAMPGAR